mgnify:FL=1
MCPQEQYNNEGVLKQTHTETQVVTWICDIYIHSSEDAVFTNEII